MASNIFAEILLWSKQLAPWQNEAIRRLFTSTILLPQDKEAIFHLAQIQYGLQRPDGSPADLMLNATDLPAPPEAGKQIRLKAVRAASNVNALKSDQRLVIGDHLTIIYGENASGKSGYARMMKKAFRARAVDPILPNVYVPSLKPAPPSAIFDIEENGIPREEKWADNTPAPECLRRFAVFDSKCARVYISENNQLSFLPYGFDIIDGLAAITGEVKQSFLDLATRSAPKPDSLKLLQDETPIGKMIGALSALTKVEDVSSVATWGEQESLSLSAKEAELAKFKASSPQVLRDGLAGRKRQIETIRDAANSMMIAISEARLTEIRTKVETLMKYEQAVGVTAKAAFGDLDFPGIGGEVWRELLLAAATYSMEVTYPGQPFPATDVGVKCVLCLQPLDNGARDRLDRFWKFIQDDVSSKRDAAKRAVKLETETLGKLPRKLPKEIEILEETLKATGSKVFEVAKLFFVSAGSRVVALETAITANVWDSIPTTATSPVDMCATEILAIDKSLTELVNDAKVNLSIASLTKEVAELKAKKRLHDNLAHVLDHLKALKRSNAAQVAAGKITTASISHKATELQTKFVTEAFKKRVQDELTPVGLIRVRAGIDKKTEKGKVLHKVTVDGATNASPDTVFSEGERTAISLACFLAELSASDDNCGIVFDDPVSSLDHRVREAIIKRLVLEATKRQVIIFTHDLVFYRELMAEAERQKISPQFQNVEAMGPTTGILSDEAPWDAQKVKTRIGRIRQVLKQAKDAEAASDPVGYRSAFRDFYTLLRSTWERSVEELLFNQVVQRLEKEVKTRSLDGVHVDSESVTAVFDGMTQTSKMIAAHDHASAINQSLPNFIQLKTDFDLFELFVQNQSKKRDFAAKQHAHLK